MRQTLASHVTYLEPKLDDDSRMLSSFVPEAHVTHATSSLLVYTAGLFTVGKLFWSVLPSQLALSCIRCGSLQPRCRRHILPTGLVVAPGEGAQLHLARLGVARIGMEAARVRKQGRACLKHSRANLDCTGCSRLTTARCFVVQCITNPGHAATRLSREAERMACSCLGLLEACSG